MFSKSYSYNTISHSCECLKWGLPRSSPHHGEGCASSVGAPERLVLLFFPTRRGWCCPASAHWSSQGWGRRTGGGAGKSYLSQEESGLRSASPSPPLLFLVLQVFVARRKLPALQLQRKCCNSNFLGLSLEWQLSQGEVTWHPKGVTLRRDQGCPSA